MAKPKNEMARRQTNALTADEAEKLFETVDETGHSNEEVAAASDVAARRRAPASTSTRFPQRTPPAPTWARSSRRPPSAS